MSRVQLALNVDDLEKSIAARADTPYLIGDLTQSFGAVVLGQCVERVGLNINEPVRRWTSGIPEASATIFILSPLISMSWLDSGCDGPTLT